MVNKINGDHALTICPVEYPISVLIVGAGSLGNLQVVLGFQNLKNMIRHTMEPMPAITSGNAGPR